MSRHIFFEFEISYLVALYLLNCVTNCILSCRFVFLLAFVTVFACIGDSLIGWKTSDLTIHEFKKNFGLDEQRCELGN